MKTEDQSAEREALPPLPAPAYGWTNDYYDGWHYDEFPQERWHELQLYTEEQMHAYARAALSAREAPAQTAAGEQVVQQTIIAHGLTVPAGMPLLKLVERLGEAIAENADLRAASPAREGWQPIETAPEEGEFLVYMPEERSDSRIQTAKWRVKVKAIGARFDFDCPPVTHWMPLPKPPAAPTTEGSET